VSTLEKRFQFTGWQQFFLVLLQISIGWHFLREGLVKWMAPNWSAEGYLMISWGPFAPMFHYIAQTDWMLATANFLMPVLLILAGLGLILGLFTRTACLIAMVNLLLFYLSTPPWEVIPQESWNAMFSSFQNAQWAGQQAPGAEGNYFIVNKNLIEFLALAAIWSCHTGLFYGLDV